MTDGSGSKELARLATAYLASIAFGLTFVTATLSGADGLTALLRGVVALLVACGAGPLLVPPIVDVVLAAMARDEAKRQAERQTEEER
jgi:hypothetical protein